MVLLALLPAMIGSQAAAGTDTPGNSRRHDHPVKETVATPLQRRAFSQPSAGLTEIERMSFILGQAFFKRAWVIAPASTQAADGLGPLYNARSCLSCHPGNGRGRPPLSADDTASALVLRIDIPPQNETQRKQLQQHRISNVPEPVYGLQLQRLAIAGHAAEYTADLSYQETSVSFADGTTLQLSKPVHRVQDPAYGPLHPQARVSPRIAPQLIGLGLLESIDEEDIVARADPLDADSDGISGRPNQVWSYRDQRVTLGRFGHKAGVANLDDQAQMALNQDIGLSTPMFPQAAGDCTERQLACRSAGNGNSARYDNLEVHQAITTELGIYLRNLAVPPRRLADHAQVQDGERIFTELGCPGCHTAQQTATTVTSEGRAETRSLHPYTDLLLHDMGEGLADQRPEAAATGREWRTAPLWGIGLTEAVTGHNRYLHDGRAHSLLEAVLWHGGEAQAQRDAVLTLSALQRRALIHFIESL